MFKSSIGGGTAFAGIEKKLSGGAPDDPGLPATMRKAVRFMLAGAAITGVFGLFVVIVTIVDKNSIDVKGKPLTSSELTFDIIATIITYVVYVMLWVLMARFNRAGQKWARIAATVLFAISTFQLYETIDSLHGGMVLTAADIIYIVITIASWAAGVGAIAMLWRPDSSAYFRERAITR
jgi:surface polysaccharide O-acyltransferase-like enzyme